MSGLRQLELDRTSDDAGSVAAMFSGELDAVIVRNAFPPDVVATVAAKLEAVAEPVPVGPGSLIALVGRPLQWVSQDLTPYFAETAKVERTLDALFPSQWPFLPRVHALLSRLAGLPIHVAQHASGARYVPATIRRMPAGAEVGPHFELGQLGFPGYATLGTQIDRTTILSYYVPMVLPESGGELWAYPLGPDHPDAARVSDEPGSERGPILSRYQPTLLAPKAGDLLVFDSGRHVHRVSKITGDRARWTIGGLVARSLDRTSLLTWA